MKNKIREWLSVQLVKNPGRMVLFAILLFNVIFFLIAAAIISALSLSGTEHMSFIEAAFCTITMILDAGCIQFVVEDIGQAGVGITLFCLFVVFIGMISFTGAVIGYVTNYISNFIETANAGSRKLHLHNHFVILNWNTRASEIVNDMLFYDDFQNIVVLVPSQKKEVEKEINERLADTIRRENEDIAKDYAEKSYLSRKLIMHRKKFKKNINVIVREGDVFSSQQLSDISLESARAVIILGNDINHSVCKFDQKEREIENSRGNAQTVKTLMQVADITSADNSSDNQRIIVEITDPWTWDLVAKIISAKQKKGKSNIIPVRVNEVLGQILSQFCLMPELNMVYKELFSSKGAEFHSIECEDYTDEISFAKDYFATHNHALPITIVEKDSKKHCFYVAENDADISKKSEVKKSDYSVSLKKDYWIEKKNVIILGHNSKCRNIMAGFESFSNEWRRGEEIVNIVVIDDKQSLTKMGYYKEYPFVNETVEADIYDKDLICETIDRVVSANEGDTSVLILSDDNASSQNIDAGALANLVYVRDIINRKKLEIPDFDEESIDVIVEIINPKHHDIVNSYDVKNVVISNRYISKMITQISDVEALFDFYRDILSYDDESTTDGQSYDSKEIYIKKVSRYFDQIPAKTKADKFVRAVYEDSIKLDKFSKPNPTIVLGYVKPGGKIEIFSRDLTDIDVELEEKDKLILFTSH